MAYQGGQLTWWRGAASVALQAAFICCCIQMVGSVGINYSNCLIVKIMVSFSLNNSIAIFDGSGELEVPVGVALRIPKWPKMTAQ